MKLPINRIVCSDVLDYLRSLPDGCVNTCVTSPPYWGLRDYGVDGQLGLESTPDEYVARMVEVFREVRRVLRDDGTLWLNLGDSYASVGGTGQGRHWDGRAKNTETQSIRRKATGRVKTKDLIGIPWRVAFALQSDGWYLRSDIIWHKPNPMPESVTDRPTKAHEYIFLMSKQERYYYDAQSIAEKAINTGRVLKASCSGSKNASMGKFGATRTGFVNNDIFIGDTRNKRTVWSVSACSFNDAHFATFPPTLIEPCIKAGCPEGGIVLDPFMGAGTTALVATGLGRNWLGCELNPEYVAIAERRLNNEVGILLEVAR